MTKPTAKDHKIFPYKDKYGRFYNFKDEVKSEFVLSSIWMLLKSKFYNFNNKDKNIIQSWFCPVKPLNKSQNLRITWIGHATFLIQVGNINILTDPLFYNASLLYKRTLPPGISYDDLPEIDYIIISHNHIDHLDTKTLNLFKHKDTTILVPLGNKSWFLKRKFNKNKIKEYSWWDSETFDLNIKFTFLPAYHWSQRSVLDYNKTLWGSWMVTYKDTNIYFAGDTAYSKHFQSIALEFPNIYCALMPVGPCEPRKHMYRSHLSSEEAGKAFLDLNAKSFIPMHWGTFYFGLDRFLAPIERIQKFWDNHNLKDKYNLYKPKVGEPLALGLYNRTSQIKDINKNIKDLEL